MPAEGAVAQQSASLLPSSSLLPAGHWAHWLAHTRGHVIWFIFKNGFVELCKKIPFFFFLACCCKKNQFVNKSDELLWLVYCCIWCCVGGFPLQTHKVYYSNKANNCLLSLSHLTQTAQRGALLPETTSTEDAEQTVASLTRTVSTLSHRFLRVKTMCMTSSSWWWPWGGCQRKWSLRKLMEMDVEGLYLQACR